MRSLIADRMIFVGVDALVLIVPFRQQETDGALDQLRQIAMDEAGVFAGELNLAAEAEVVANKHRCASDDARREHLVVAVAQADHPAIIFAGFAALDFHEAEVTHPIVSEAVGDTPDGQVGGGQCALNRLDELMMRDGLPC